MITIRASFVLLMALLSSPLFALDVSVSYGLGEFENDVKTKRLEASIKKSITNNIYVKGELVREESYMPVKFPKNRAFIGGGYLVNLSHSIISGDVLFSAKSWKVTPRISAEISNKYNILAGIQHGNDWSRKRKTTILFSGVERNLDGKWSIAAIYYNGHLTKRSEYDYLKFRLKREF